MKYASAAKLAFFLILGVPFANCVEPSKIMETEVGKRFASLSEIKDRKTLARQYTSILEKCQIYEKEEDIDNATFYYSLIMLHARKNRDSYCESIASRYLAPLLARSEDRDAKQCNKNTLRVSAFIYENLLAKCLKGCQIREDEIRRDILARFESITTDQLSEVEKNLLTTDRARFFKGQEDPFRYVFIDISEFEKTRINYARELGEYLYGRGLTGDSQLKKFMGLYLLANAGFSGGDYDSLAIMDKIFAGNYVPVKSVFFVSQGF
ncbi:MAG: hypothetical protein LBL99_03050 [Holosporaceae bacterium]|jgi:hypothetical protein|nr:hypothetical protein [Holosporaceae bacterium]